MTALAWDSARLATLLDKCLESKAVCSAGCKISASNCVARRN